MIQITSSYNYIGLNNKNNWNYFELFNLCLRKINGLLSSIFTNVVKDCTAGVTPESNDAAIKTMEMCQIEVI